jgi:uncharacterized protein YmfQ (DUF2313 family)
MATPNSFFGKLLSCFASEMNRLEIRVIALIRESVPGLCVELLEDFERVLALPEDLMPPAQSQGERQANVHAKWTAKYSGLSKTFFIDYAARLGITITIDETGGVGTPFRLGGASTPNVTRVGNRFWSAATLYTWRVNVAQTEPNFDSLVVSFEKLKPAHTIVVFNRY